MTALLSIACWIGSAGLLTFHAYEWLRHGVWASYSLATALQWLGSSWAASPMDWLGLHSAANALPLWLALMLAGFAGSLIEAGKNA